MPIKSHLKTLHVLHNLNTTTETFVHNQIEGLSKMGIPVYIFSLIPFKGSLSYDSFLWSNRKVGLHFLYSLHFGLIHLNFCLKYLWVKKDCKNRFWIKTNLLNLIRLVGLAVLLKRNEISIIHFHFGDVAEYFMPLKRFCVAKICVSFYGRDATPGRLVQLKNVFKYSDLILVLSKKMRETILPFNQNNVNILVHQLAVDLGKLPPLPEKRKNQVVFVGRLVEKKDILTALKVFKMTLEKVGEWKFVICGNGPFMGEACQYVQDHQLEHWVEFKGLVSHLVVLQVMSESKIFFLPSKTASDGDSEGTPTVIMEAQCLGLPVVSTRHAGIPEILKEGETGLLSREKDIQNLAKNLNHIIQAPKELERMGKNAFEFGRASFDLVKWTKLLQERYLSLFN